MPITYHPLVDADQAVMTQLRAMIASQPRMELVPTSRAAFDDFMLTVPSAEGITFEAAEIGGVPGWWCRPSDASKGAIVYFHGGAYIVGSAHGYRHLASQISARTGTPVFVADYALAPEHPFPAALDDAMKLYQALTRADMGPIALAGDSAGGGLVLALLAATGSVGAPVAAAVMSPLADLTLTGGSYDVKAGDDPLLSRATIEAAAQAYAAGADRTDRRMSPMLDVPVALPPTLIHVGADEVLLDDALGYVTAAEASGNVAEVHVWEGMTHVFPANFAMLAAGEAALRHLCQFLRDQLATGASR